jgi:hypothetical protein
MQAKSIIISKIYVPIKRRSTLDQKTVDSLAEAILEEGQKYLFKSDKTGSGSF